MCGQFDKLKERFHEKMPYLINKKGEILKTRKIVRVDFRTLYKPLYLTDIAIKKLKQSMNSKISNQSKIKHFLKICISDNSILIL